MSETTSAGLGSLASPARRSPRQRARRSRAVQYTILVAILIVLAIVTDWSTVGQQMFNQEAIGEMWHLLPRAFANTIIYTLGAFVIGLAGGSFLALMRTSSVRVYRWLATGYIEFFRGIPSLLVIFTVAFAVPMAFGINFPSVTLKVSLALGITSAAYIAETLRAGLQAVPRGQIEAARSLGMSHTRALISVVIPQAFRIVLPPLTNEIIMLTKDTSLVYIAGLQIQNYELTKVGTDMLSRASGGVTALFVVGLCYLIITVPLGFLARRLEKSSTTGGKK